MNIYMFLNPITRTFTCETEGVAAVRDDYEVDAIVFKLPSVIENADPFYDTKIVSFTIPGSTRIFTRTLDQIDSDANWVYVTWPLTAAMAEKVGTIRFALLLKGLSQDLSTITTKWRSQISSFSIVDTLSGSDTEPEEEEEDATTSEKIAALNSAVFVLQSQIDKLGNGTPIPVSLAAEMTDPETIYVYTGSETGYTYGYWYYYNDAEQEWQEGRQYGGPHSGSIETDDIAEGAVTLSKLAPEIRDNFTDDAASGVSYNDTNTNLGATTVQQAIEKVVKNNVYNCTFTGNDIAGYSYATGSTYAGLYAAVSAGFPAYVKYAETTGVPDTYHLIYVNGEEMLFLCIRGQNVKTFVIDPDSVQHASVSYAQSTDVTAAINALKGIYDPRNLQADVFSYASGRVDDLYDNYVSPIITDIRGAYTIHTDGGDSVYTSLGAAVNGVLTAAQAYTRARLVEYKAFTISIVDELPVAGDPMTFYLVPKDNGGYDKWWWITNEDNESVWDVFGSATTLVVTTLPEAGDEDTDYILKTSSGCLYYKYIDGEWNMVAGSLAEIVTELPVTGNAYTDYYCQNAQGVYVHYRWIDNAWETIGSEGYTKSEVNALISGLSGRIDTVSEGLSSTDQNVSSLSRTVERVAQDLANLDTEGYTYYAALSQDANSNYIYTLYEVDGTEETVKSQFTLPSGGGGGGGAVTEMTVERLTDSPVIVTPTDSVTIQITYSSVDGDGEQYDGTYSWKIGSTTVMSGSLIQGLNTFDLTEHCSVGTQKLILTVTDSAGSTVVKSWTVQIVDVRLESAFSDRYTNALGRAVNFTYTPYGSVPKTVHFKLDGVELESVTTSASGTLQSYTLSPQTHGAHLLECWITATVNSTPIETEHIFKDIIWYDESSSLPVIGCAYRYDHYGQVSARQYDTTRIAYVVYDPSTSTPAVTLAVDGVTVNQLTLTEALNTWAYKADDVAVHVLTITCRGTSVEIRVNVHELGYDVSPVTANLEFDFDPIGRSNTAANRLWHDENHPEVEMTVSNNFDWQNGGYKIDNDGNQYFCVKAGSRAYISYDLFGADPVQAGAEFKVIFKTENVRDNTTTFLSCLQEGDANKVGLEMKAHAAYLKTSTDELYMPYSEEDVIEYEYNINTLDLENAEAKSYIMTYEDGVGARPLIYDASHRIYQYAPAPITIGSDDCDVWIYRMKAYSSALSDTDILRNFIADSRDSSTMIDRYERNQIYDENNQLTPESVANACPDLRVIMIDCPHFTNDKKDYVRNTNVRCIYRNGDAAYDNWTWNNGYHAGQGTTSNEYGFAGRNIDIIFGFDGVHQRVSKIPLDASYISELVLGDGTRYTDGSGKVGLTRQSVPNDWFNIKVNIASSENANNALLQKRYNDYIPYKTPGQKKDSRRKNSMEFQNCVIFVRENDPDVSTHREFEDTSWHFYGIGNIGDSKKTDNTRVNDPTDLAEFVVEVSDNTLPNSWFQTGVYLDANDNITYDPELGVSMVYPITAAQWNNANNLKKQSLYEAWDDSFEFRYDMGTKDGETITSDEIEAQQELSKQVWRDMYEWVITSTDAEFVSQFNNWFIRESPLYWYLFTERYTMIDNRAKNSFWHWGKTYITEAEAVEMGDDAQYYTIDNVAAAINGGYRFDLWDYDNDTALGINNSGELTMTYGHEDIDYKTDGDPSSGFIYNAAQSVFWRRIRGLMHSQLQALYLDRESAGCWSAESLINQWDAWQEQFPEELWRLDIERKYLRTYQAGTVRFLNEMMNGRKKYQRRQFERDQEAYIGTKYVGTTVRADQIMFRCNTPSSAVVAPDYTLRLVPYSDMYLTVLYGNSPAPVQVRAKAGTEYTLETALTEMDDTAILIYCASRIQAINDLSACYIHDNDFSKASKLKTLIIGNTTAGYTNQFLTTLNMGNNTLLETLDIRNCPNLTGSVNLSACENLVTLYAEGTALTSVLFATNGKIALAHLPATINSLTFKSIQYLTDLIVASYGNLESFTCEYSNLDALTIIQTAIETLQIVRVLGIDWTLATTDLLNTILRKSSTLLSGSVYISGPIRLKELENYEAAWPDLEVTYDAGQLVTQYVATFVDWDGTVLCEQYVDRGSAPVDPIANGDISTPTRASDAQYSYTFSGWDDIESAMLTGRTITAEYTGSIRTYTVNWYSRAGILLDTAQAEYGASVEYSGDRPTREDEEGTYVFNVFRGWDKSTSFIVEDTNVYALWRRSALPSVGTELNTMDAAEIYGVCKSGMANTYFEDKDYFDLTLGNDFEFSNVESRVICQNRFFDGSTAVDTDIQLFNAAAPSFTLAIDYEFLSSNSANASLVSCYDEAGNEGFRLRYSSHPYIQWGDKEQQVGHSDKRNLVVLRHAKGSDILYIYAFNSEENTVSMSGTNAILTRARSTSTNAVLTLGAIRFQGDGGHDYYATGWIHWAKIWFQDLGAAHAVKLAAWPHETLRMEYCGAGRYRYAGTSSSRVGGSFLAGNASYYLRRWNPSSTNVGGWNGSEIRSLMSSRLYAALPEEWKSIITKVKILASAGNRSTEIITSEDYIYLASEREAGGSTSTPYVNEGEAISYMTSGESRIRFAGLIIPADAQVIRESTDPTTLTTYTVRSGDIWIHTGNSSYGYIYVPSADAAKHTHLGGRKASASENIPAGDGGLWVRANNWWLRSASVDSTSAARIVNTTGGLNNYNANGANALVPGFSIG